MKTEVRRQKAEIFRCKPALRTLHLEPSRVLVANRQKALKVEKSGIQKLVSFFLHKSARRTGLHWGEVSVVLVNDRESREVNRVSLGHDYPTDVISFNFDPLPGEDAGACNGEIVVNAERALSLGKRHGGANRELTLYLAHGCDHLSGADDATPEQRMTMRRRELRWMKEAGEKGFRIQGSGDGSLVAGLRTRAS